MKGLFAVLCLLSATAAFPAEPSVTVELDQARAVLQILDAQASGRQPHAHEWQQLRDSRGYRRLLDRQAGIGHADGFDEALRNWLVTSTAIEQREKFRQALSYWENFDPAVTAERANRYLPPGVELRATLYPVIKHTKNSFVFDLQGEPSIFLNVNPVDTPVYLEAVMTHELHHVGLARCGKPADYARLTPVQQKAVDWLGIFGEGLAMLATAGDPLRHPHYFSSEGEYLVWERDVARFGHDLQRVQSFFERLLANVADEEAQRRALYSLISTEHVPQGPAYTVGWKMAAIVERHFGRDMLVKAMCDPRELLHLYNQAASTVAQTGGEPLPRWSETFLQALQAE